MARTQVPRRAQRLDLSALERLVVGSSGSLRRPALFLIITIIIAEVIEPSFLSPSNISALLISSSMLFVITVGEAFVVMLGMIDLGVESVLAAGGMLAAWLYVLHRMPAAEAVPFTLLFGIAVGLAVGILVTKARIPSFIVTLGIYWGFKGVALLFNGGNYIGPDAVSPSRDLTFLGIASSTFGISNLIILSIVVIILAQLVMSYTPFGTWLKSVGSSEESARAVGLNTTALKIAVFVISGFLAALAGIMMGAYQDSIYPSSGEGDSLEAIAAVILGGIPFTGGRGTIVGAAIGALVIGVINDLIVLLGLPALYEYIFVALVLIVAGLQARAGAFVK